jgi:hypothetical protein
MLPYYLASYLGLPHPSVVGMTTNVVKAFICPGYKSTAPANTASGYNPESDNYMHAYSYSVTRGTNGPDWSLPGLPFGKENLSQPLKLSAMSASAPLSSIWAGADLDTTGITDPSGLGTPLPYVAVKPVHGKVRCFLFFDLHAATKRVTTPLDYTK